MRNHILLFLVLVSISGVSYANDMELLEKARAKYFNYEFDKSIELYQKIIDTSTNNDYKALSNFTIGYIYSMYLLDNFKAIEYYKKALSFNSNYKNTYRKSLRNLEQEYKRIGNKKNIDLYSDLYQAYLVENGIGSSYLKQEDAHNSFLRGDYDIAINLSHEIEVNDNNTINNRLLYYAMNGDTNLKALVNEKKDVYLFAFALSEHKQGKHVEALQSIDKYIQYRKNKDNSNLTLYYEILENFYIARAYALRASIEKQLGNLNYAKSSLTLALDYLHKTKGIVNVRCDILQSTILRELGLMDKDIGKVNNAIDLIRKYDRNTIGIDKEHLYNSYAIAQIEGNSKGYSNALNEYWAVLNSESQEEQILFNKSGQSLYDAIKLNYAKAQEKEAVQDRYKSIIEICIVAFAFLVFLLSAPLHKVFKW